MNGIEEKLKGPAIGLIVIGSLNCLTALTTLLGGAARLTIGPENLPADEAERVGFLIGTVVGYGIALIGLLIAPFIILGGIKMLRGQSHTLARAAAVLAIIPLISCCFIAGIPVGIWALSVLRDPSVKRFFSGLGDPADYFPPNPPTF